MADAIEKKRRLTRDEYLDTEAHAEFKSEYYNGEIFAMTGGSPQHSMICFNLIRRIGEAADKQNCIGFESNLKLEISAKNAFVYPDIMVVCGKPELPPDCTDAIRNPMLIIEVLSPSAESFDRGKKFEYYRTLPSLKEYVLVSQSRPAVETFFKQYERNWLFTAVNGLSKSIVLQSLDDEIALQDIYKKVFDDQISTRS